MNVSDEVREGRVTRSGVTSESVDGVLWIVMDNPSKLNAVDLPMVEELHSTLLRESVDGAVRVVVLTGAGRAFSSGANLGTGTVEEVAAEGDQLVDAVNELIRVLTKLPVPVVAAVNGPAVGVAVSMVLACDLAVASTSAYFLLPFSSIGLIPDGGATSTIARSIGSARAAAMMLGGRKVDSVTAESWGLVAEVAESGDPFERRILDIAQSLVAGPRDALAATKKALRVAASAELDAALGFERTHQAEQLRGPEFAEGLSAFRERRPARFGGAVIAHNLQ
nr:MULTISPECIES: enoyl-CoA hydratase-related protein [unclassified Rhodococcus (in: high G+C Gram-positive bacteria)]